MKKTFISLATVLLAGLFSASAIAKLPAPSDEAKAKAAEAAAKTAHGNKVADDMIDHSTHHVIHAEYAGPEESKHHEKEAAKLRAKNKISGDIYGREEK